MTEEEKKAIEYYKDYAEILNNELILYGHIKTLKVDYKKLKTLVNLIQKKDTEINKLKEEIERLEATIEDYKLMRLNKCSFEVEGELFITLEKLLKEYKRQKEINEEHQKLNGNLQKRITELEKENKTLKAINRGKSIRELGVSDLYGEKQ